MVRLFSVGVRRSIACAVIATAVLYPATALPDHDKSQSGSYINAFACGDMPAKAALQVISTDDADEALAFRKHLIKVLGKRGFSENSEARIRLTVDIKREVEAAPRRKPDLVELSRREQEPAEGGPGGGYETRVEVNIWSNRKDSIIGGRTSSKTGRVVERLRLEISINDGKTGACLWNGTAFHDLAGGDFLTEAKRVTGPLVRKIGKKAAHEPFVPD